MAIQAVAWVLEEETTTTGAERLVLLALANHAGWSNGRWECWPGIETIAREANVSRRETVRNALVRLVERGLIERIVKAAPDERIRDDRRPNLYVLHLGATPRETSPRETDQRPHAERVHDPTRSARATPRETGGKPLGEPLEEPSLEPRSALPALPPEFDRFWAIYPRRTGKGAARIAYAKARTKVPYSHLMQRVLEYANDPNRDPAFTPHPATWLNQERWDDDPLPSKTNAKPPSIGARLLTGIQDGSITNESLRGALHGK